ncbi:DUF7133 domain-containing protein [Verrucomicrobium spinosum]|uniref:DUF7133 domain-containing protein n=1 Tax=Verrucomicrobium spinosum TaxID=2736 RepID=UPI0012E14CC4|nr:hypothetical protein [Verrucomicrobium spinosum]
MASEPGVEQPLCMTWDSRGRLWVTLYRQYQFPAGLKIVKYDQHLRAVFDRVPEPPPKGPRGPTRWWCWRIPMATGSWTPRRP